MIFEVLEWLATPCAADLRRLGYRTELVAIGARHRRRRQAWDDHLTRSRRAIERAVERTASRRTAVVLGSGRLLDVPLELLARSFERVVLVDAVHPLSARLQVLRHANVELMAADITGVIAQLRRIRPGDTLPTPRPFAPIHQPEVDLVISLNLLSQLGVLPEQWLTRRLGAGAAAEAANFAAALTAVHLDDLKDCRATVCLVADVEWHHLDPQGRIVERGSSIYDVPAPQAVDEWTWQLAPAPELDPLLSERRRVIVAFDPGQRPA